MRRTVQSLFKPRRLFASTVFLFLLMQPFRPGGSASVRVEEGEGDYVVLLHGILGFQTAMEPTAHYLHEQGYHTVMVTYPSREQSIPDIAEQILKPVIDQVCTNPGKKIHFVGHSMGAIVIRSYLEHHRPANLGRVVLLAAPNRGSELAERYAETPLVGDIFGPAIRELGTDEDDLPNLLGPVDYETGVIMGESNFWPFFESQLPEGNDGIVSVESGRLGGIRDFEVVPEAHNFIKRSEEVYRKISYFLEGGTFEGGPGGSPLPEGSLTGTTATPGDGAKH